MNDIKRILGKRIKELRTAKKLKQAELAEIVDIDPRSISKIESGYHFPKDEHLEKLAFALDVELKDLFTFSHIKNSETLIEEINKLILKADETKLITIYRIIETLMK